MNSNINLQKFLTYICYSFLIGIAISMIFLQNLPYKKINFLFWIFTILFFLTGFHFKIRGKEAKTLFYLCLSFFLFGIIRYFNVADTSSKYHITKYLNESFNQKTIIRGTIIRDPDDRVEFCFIDVKPDEIITRTKNEPEKIIKLKGKTGYIRSKVYPGIGKYYFSMSYGDRIEINSAILAPRTLSNPAGFDYRKYLKARNVYATTPSLRYENQIKYLGPGELGFFDRIVQFSFKLRKRLLLTIRKTMPFPESAFLGGVTLGLRGGVPANVKYEFQATGVAHVLALSGLHVGFVAALLYIIAVIIRLKRKIRFIVISLGLLIFTLLTGATPATQRAALMFVTGLFFKDILDWSFGGSAQVTIPISAFIILLLNPLWLPDASFILSFMAVWSLVYVTPPIQRFLIEKKYDFIHNWITFPFFTVIFGMTIISLVFGILREAYIVKKFFPFFENIKQVQEYIPNWFYNPNSPILYKPQFFILSLVLWIAGVSTSLLYRMSGRDIVEDMWYSPIGKGLLSFTCSQLAIQIGMMWPLSAIYFYRFPIAGFYANFFAIPLIGWIVQLGWIAGLLDIMFGWIKLPIVMFSAKTLGELFSLLVNAFNWQLCQMFLGLAKTWAGLVPYPFTETFSTGNLVLWYSVVFLLILHKKIAGLAQAMYLRYKKMLFSFGLLILIIITFILFLPAQIKPKKMKVIFFDSGFGNAVFVETPSGKNILIDGGSDGSEWNFGKTAIGATFSKYKIKHLDVGVITSFNPTNVGGFIYVIGAFPTKKIFLPIKKELFLENLTYHEFISKINDWRFLYNPYDLMPMKIYLSYYDFSKTLKRLKAELIVPKQNETIYEENDFKIISLTPFENMFEGSNNDFKNNYTIVLKIVWGEKSIILPTQIAQEGQKKLCEIYDNKLKSDIMLVPCNGSPDEFNSEFLEKVSPEFAVCQYGWSYEPGFFSEDSLKKTQEFYKNRGIKFLRTDKVGAVTFEIDRKKILMKTVFPYESI